MMNMITDVHCEYNENILTDNYKNTNNILWTATNLTGATMVESSQYGYEEGRCLHLHIDGLDVDETEFGPTNPDDLNFEVLKSGGHIFSFRTVLKGNTPFYPELTGRFYLTRVGGAPLTIPLDFNIGSNTFPEFTFEYNKYATFYCELPVAILAGEVYTLSGQIDASPTWYAGPIDIFFAGFKLENIVDKNYNIPTYYTKPVSSGATSTSYIEVSALTNLEYYHKTVVVTANSFNIVLPPALPCKGKIMEIVNKGAGTTTLMGYGIDTIDGNPSLGILTETTVRVISNGIVWKVLSVSNN